MLGAVPGVAEAEVVAPVEAVGSGWAGGVALAVVGGTVLVVPVVVPVELVFVPVEFAAAPLAFGVPEMAPVVPNEPAAPG